MVATIDRSDHWHTVLLTTMASLVVAGLAVGLLFAGATAATDGDGVAETTLETELSTQTTWVHDERTSSLQSAQSASPNVSEPAVQKPVPEPGDEWFEAEAADGSWVSYINPRDEYRSPYLGDGSGKVCVTLLNEAGEPITGESTPDTTVTVPTGDSLDWHSGADPMTVTYPLTDNYERPLDADQFGTSDDVAQGDGYLDSHCIEFHGMPEDGEIEYGEASVEGEHADRFELVGYIQQDGQSWDSSVDPIEDAVSYEEAGGGWTYEPEHSHGQAVVVFQLTDEADGSDSDDTGDGSGERDDDDADGDTNDSDDSGADDPADGDSSDDRSDDADDDSGASDDEMSDEDDTDETSDEDDTDDASDGGADGLPGFDTLVTFLALGALVVAALASRHGET